MIELIGYCAAFLTTLSFVPQALQVIKTKDTHSISLQMYVIFSAGVVLWLVYGIWLRNIPMIIANSITIVLASIILYYKLKEK
ncbi:MAG TPA: SemiSWEET transporter [Bacteroidales bacterium]|jgi:MtN3 and saliva related transmembrane protein|nr:SemiSWEET transporter [Bacteroidales bacterium]HRS19145.1 SemiSWEET transporter [Bacteroidales bacterium]